MTDYEIIDRIIEREGGDKYTDRPSDRGGPTKFGITQRAWSEYRARHAEPLPEHVRDLTLEHARQFYWIEHVAPFAWIVSAPLRELTIDCSVNHGRSRATRWLQEAAGVVTDGVIGPVTKTAVNALSYNTYNMYSGLLRKRFKFYAQIASDQLPADPDLPNLRGWISRACEFIR